MKITRLLWFPLLLILFFQCKPIPKTQSQSDAAFKIAFYNLENLFDTIDDPKTNDKDFLPDGYYHWSKQRYQQKLKNIAFVLSEIDADLIGIAEVENKEVLEDLILLLPKKNYKIIHYESHDVRGIDNALLYTDDFDLITSKDLTARLENNGYAGSRGILKAEFSVNSEELTVYVNHWSSRKNGKEENRMAYAKTLLKDMAKYNASNVVVMGDFNDTPSDASIQNLVNGTSLNNPFYSLAKDGKGTATYKADWFLFDQILYATSSFDKTDFGIVELKEIKNQAKGKYQGFPLRTFIGNRYNAQGCSDHFPVYLQLSTK